MCHWGHKKPEWLLGSLENQIRNSCLPTSGRSSFFCGIPCFFYSSVHYTPYFSRLSKTGWPTSQALHSDPCMPLPCQPRSPRRKLGYEGPLPISRGGNGCISLPCSHDPRS